MVDIPVELFITFIGASIAMGLFGFLRQPQIPAMLVFAGMFIMTFALITDNIIIGYTEQLLQKTQESAINGTTTFQYVTVDAQPNLYSFTELPKTLFALLGAIFMLAGALMVVRFQ